MCVGAYIYKNTQNEVIFFSLYIVTLVMLYSITLILSLTKVNPVTLWSYGGGAIGSGTVVMWVLLFFQLRWC